MFSPLALSLSVLGRGGGIQFAYYIHLRWSLCAIYTVLSNGNEDFSR